MAAKKGESLHKESDSITRAGISALYKIQKEADEIKSALKKDPELIQRVRDFIFSGDPVAVSPLADIRKKSK